MQYMFSRCLSFALSLTPAVQPGEVLRVYNGFKSDWRPSGYRDVKLNPVVAEHLCEIQLQLRSFFKFKANQHKAYEWARELKVTKKMKPEDLLKNLSPEVMEAMIRLARGGWWRIRSVVPHLQIIAGQFNQAEELFRQVLR